MEARDPDGAASCSGVGNVQAGTFGPAEEEGANESVANGVPGDSTPQSI